MLKGSVALAVFVLLSACFVGGVQAEDMYGAIAYASDGSWGWAVDYTDQQSANNAAESQCGDCEVVLEFQNTCAAFALGDGGEGWASGDDPEEVQYAALDACSSVGTDCEVKNWACTSR